MTVAFTGSVAVTFAGHTVSRGGPDSLTGSPATWVAYAQEALDAIVEELGQ